MKRHPWPLAKGGSHSKHIRRETCTRDIALEAAFCSQLPRRPIGRQAYGAYPARVNLSRFVGTSDVLYCCKVPSAMLRISY
jgi:hypothetical protein